MAEECGKGGGREKRQRSDGKQKEETKRNTGEERDNSRCSTC